MWLSGWTSYKVSHERAKFGDYGQFGSGDVMVLTSDVILQDQATLK